jgi:hypothetical protein
MNHPISLNKRYKREYNSWISMRNRVNCKESASYVEYGGRGITICSRWDSFENFLKDMGERPIGNYTLDRREVNGNYEPSNCRWATVLQQARNKRNNSPSYPGMNQMTTHKVPAVMTSDPLEINKNLPISKNQKMAYAGERFHNLVAMNYVYGSNTSLAGWRFECDCGNTVVVDPYIVKFQKMKHCRKSNHYYNMKMNKKCREHLEARVTES